MPALPPSKESERLAALHELAILDTAPERVFDDIARLASAICTTPMAVVSLMDDTRLWFKARVGLDVSHLPREHTFCAHAQESGGEVLEIPDAADDPRFSDHPMVRGEPHIRFYAGAPIMSPEGHILGSVCAIDRMPRALTAEQRDALGILSRQTMQLMLWRREMLDRQSRLVAQWQRDRHLLVRTLAATTHSLDMQAFVDPQGICRYVNARLLEYGRTTRERVEGHPVVALLGEPYRTDVESSLQQALDGETVEFSRSIDFPDKGRRFVEFTVLPVRDSGEVIGVLVRGHDAQVRRQAQLDLEEALGRLTERNTRQQEFIYMVSHDLREPVNAIRNFSGLLLEDAPASGLPPEAVRYLGFVRDGGERLREMLDALLEYVKQDAPRAAFKAVDLARVFDELEVDLSVPIRASGAHITRMGLGVVWGQRAQLRLLFQNLLSNALKFRQARRAPRIVVRGEQLGPMLRISVTDNGIGIPATQLPKLFGLFRRHVTQREFAGTGLGLALCKRIVELHDGRIQLQSEPDVGTTVIVDLPLPPVADPARALQG